MQYNGPATPVVTGLLAPWSGRAPAYDKAWHCKHRLHVRPNRYWTLGTFSPGRNTWKALPVLRRSLFTAITATRGIRGTGGSLQMKNRECVRPPSTRRLSLPQQGIASKGNAPDSANNNSTITRRPVSGARDGAAEGKKRLARTGVGESVFSSHVTTTEVRVHAVGGC